MKRTDGVPLFAEELTRLILEGDGRAAVREILATLHDSLAARLDRLGPAKDVAQVAAVIGREFSYELLQAVAAIPSGDLEAALETLVSAELIYARGTAPEAIYQFKHALIQMLRTKRCLRQDGGSYTAASHKPSVTTLQPWLRRNPKLSHGTGPKLGKRRS